LQGRRAARQRDDGRANGLGRAKRNDDRRTLNDDESIGGDGWCLERETLERENGESHKNREN
jgi:hypothetical protein